MGAPAGSRQWGQRQALPRVGAIEGDSSEPGLVAGVPWCEHTCWLSHWALNEGAGELGTVGAPGSVELQA